MAPAAPGSEMPCLEGPESALKQASEVYTLETQDQTKRLHKGLFYAGLDFLLTKAIQPILDKDDACRPIGES